MTATSFPHITRMKQLAPLIILLLLIQMFAACDKRPNGVLPKNEMEEVLYDYHLALGIIERLPSAEKEAKAQDYINAVMAKHHITEDQFDRSLIYYNRHAKDLNNIYSNIKDRYAVQNEELQLKTGSNSMTAIFTTGGDTANLWQTSPVIVLRDKDILNKESFFIKADTSYHRYDKYILTFTPAFAGLTSEDYKTNLHVGLSVIYDTGNHIGITRMTKSNTTMQLTLESIKEDKIKAITGFFYYSGKTSGKSVCIANNISLVRMHRKEAPADTIAVDTLKADTTTVDTLHNDSIDERIQQRLTPEEIREMNRSDRQIKIQEAPSVRTPNSIGPRRRTNKHEGRRR